MKLFRKLYLIPVYGYRKVISPLLPNACRFYPTCSSYMIEAVMAFGIIKGTYLALRRILRCNPFCNGGIDPVPDRFSWSRKKRCPDSDPTAAVSEPE